MTRHLLIAGLMTCLCGTVQAADLDDAILGPTANELDWSGAYIGFGVGHGSYIDVDDRFGGFKSKGEDYGYSVHAGYNKQLGNIVLGIEAEIMPFNSEFDLLPPGFPPGSVAIEDIFSFRAKAGYAVGNFMPYATAGFGYATTNISDLEGWGGIYGAGIDTLVFDKFIVGFQYVHHTYNDFGDVPLKADFDLFNLRVSYKF